MTRSLRLGSWMAAVPMFVALTGLPASAVYADLAPTCQGQPATIVGQPGDPYLAGQTGVKGTPGRDVIVSNGADWVSAGAGDDLICVTGRTYSVDAGDGDDVVDTTAADGTVSTTLGAGADTFIGGNATDQVNTGQSGDYGTTRTDTSHDEIHTGGGEDIVYSGDLLHPARPNDDLVDLGSGNDHLYLAGNAADADIDGGTGNNALAPEVCCDGGPVLVDNDRQQIWSSKSPEAARLVASYRGIFNFFSFNDEMQGARYSSIGFIGSSRAEQVDFGERPLQKNDARFETVKFNLGGGNDSVYAPEVELRGEIRGGPGSDVLVMSSWAHRSVSVHVGSSVTTDGRRRTGLYGIQGLALRMRTPASAVLTGTNGPDRLAISGGSGGKQRVYGRGGNDAIYGGNAINGTRLDGGSGNDRIVGGLRADRLYGGPGNDYLGGRAGNDRLYGGPGKDVLYGQTGKDYLNGGRGHDRVDGGPQRDRCIGEVRHRCELR